MQSNSKIAVGCWLLLSLGGCGGGAGYPRAPSLADPQIDTLAVAARSDAGSALTEPGEQANPEPRIEMPAQAPQGGGPRATSGEVRFDSVGYAGMGGEQAGVSIIHPDLAPGSFVELTALDSGRTIIALVSRNAPASAGRAFTLSPAAAQALRVGDGAALRIRTVRPTPPEQVALRQGVEAAPRIDAPAALLVALRKRLVPMAANLPDRAAAPAPRAAAAPHASAVAAPPQRALQRAVSGPGYYVQVVALSDIGRARALALGMNGRVVPGGGFYRVQIGPYGSEKSAETAREGVARRGYGDARIVKAN